MDRTTSKLTYKEIVEDTVWYYSENPGRRAIDGNNNCMYYNPQTENCCAIGRYMKHPEEFTIEEVGELDYLELMELVDNDFNGIMKEEVYNMKNDEFWVLLQSLHDVSNNWATRGLSELGKEKCQKLLELANKLNAEG